MNKKRINQLKSAKIYTNIEVGEVANWFYCPIKYKGEVYIDYQYYIDCSELVLIDDNENEIIRISSKSNYFTVLEYELCIELIEQEVV